MKRRIGKIMVLLAGFLLCGPIFIGAVAAIADEQTGDTDIDVDANDIIGELDRAKRCEIICLEYKPLGPYGEDICVHWWSPCSSGDYLVT